MSIDKMKSFFIEEKEEITFNEFGEKFGHHPILILYDWSAQEYFYIKARSARDKNGKLRDAKQGEIFVPKDLSKTEIYHRDFYVDTTKLYHVNEKELDSHVNKEQVATIEQIDVKFAIKIFDMVVDNLRMIPPYISLMKVSYNEENEEFQSYTEYSHKELLDREMKNESQMSLYNEILNKRNNEINLRHISVLANSINYEKTQYIWDNQEEYDRLFGKFSPNTKRLEKELEEEQKKSNDDEMAM